MQERATSADDHDPRARAALDELRELIAARYPTASFEVSRGPDDRRQILLRTVVDVDDPDEVLDLVGERLLQLQVEEQIPLHVIPVRTPERIVAETEARARAGAHHPRRTIPLIDVLSP
jgi:hypothetical protein